MHTLVLLFVAAPAEAHSTGMTGRSTIGCTCHGAAPDATTSVAFGVAPTVVLPGDLVPLTLTVSSTNATRVAGGLDVASAAGGTFVAGSNTQVLMGEITHPTPQAFTAGTALFDFTWVAPAADGFYTLTAAGNAVNLSGTNVGDGWNFAPSIVIEVDNPCDDVDGDGVDTCSGDCDDDNPAVNPLEPEVCDTLDNDCDGYVDDGAIDAGTWYVDSDRDGYGVTSSAVVACTAPFGDVDQGGDCDDGSAAVNPGEAEICDPGDVDQDCNGVADDPAAVDAVDWYADGDGDGYGAGAPTHACDAPPGAVALDGDCDDGDTAFNPGAPETDCADPTDYNCDGSTGFADADGDGFAACNDCDDASAASHPGGTEVCDGHDDDCDGSVDEADATDAVTWYEDQDLDGHGVTLTTVVACTAPPGFAGVSDDCNDRDATINPDAAEVWYDGTDQNCDGNDGDQDGDGVDHGTDCLDTDPDVYPGATDVPYDGIDADCAGDDDFDADKDGVAAEIGGGGDCDDDDASVHPGAEDPPCDGIDVDCDAAPDFDPSCGSTTTGGTTGGTTADGNGGTPDGKLGCSCSETGSFPAGVLAVPILVGLRRRAARSSSASRPRSR